jgi:ribosomal protein S18 acetylase RimI-like enzyme
MYAAFKNAFLNYFVPFELSEEHFRKKFVEKLSINFGLSAGAFYGQRLVGFVFTSVNRYEGLLTAYNGGTGVIPKYRGNDITEQLYNYLIPKFRNENIKQCILEVLVENKAAIKVYQNCGFSISRNFKCYKLNPAISVSDKVNIEVRIQRVPSPDWKIYTKFFDYIPCYLDSRHMIENNLSNEVIVEATLGDMTLGYAIFQPDSGRISQIAVNQDHRKEGIGSMLLRYIYENSFNKLLTMINVLEEAETIQHFLTKSGFENELNQYEMRLLL